MWILQSCAAPENYYAILPGKEYVVGRKDCQIVLENDRSISRKHAVLKLIKSEANGSTTPFLLKLVDCSKFGTNINGEKIQSDCLVNDGDQIMFGILGNRWRVTVNVPIVTTSCMRDANEKKTFLKTLEEIGGKCVPEWNEDCTHLVMENTIMTVKAICALASSKPIVTPNYFFSWLRSLQQRKPFPDTMGYIPPLKEALLQNEDIKLFPCEERKQIFKGKTFIFFSLNQLLKLKMAIKLGNGDTLFLNRQPETKLIMSPNSVVMSYPSSEHSQSPESQLAKKTGELLKSNFKRTVQESEIGLAVAFNSTMKYCNPDFNIASTLLGSLDSGSQSCVLNNTVLASDTQSHSNCNTNTEPTERITIDVDDSTDDSDVEIVDSKDSDSSNVSKEKTENSRRSLRLSYQENKKPHVRKEEPENSRRSLWASNKEDKKRLRNDSSDSNLPAAKVIKLENKDELSQFEKNSTSILLKAESENILIDDSNKNSNQVLNKVNSVDDKSKIQKIIENKPVKTNKSTDEDFMEIDNKTSSQQVLVEFSSSLIRKNTASVERVETNINVPNFKKFRKVRNETATPITDLSVYEMPIENVGNVSLMMTSMLQVNDQESQENPFG